MADEDDIDDEIAEEGETPEGEEGGKRGSKKKLLIIAALILLLVTGGIAGAYFTGLLDPLMEMVLGIQPTEEEAGLQDTVFYELPELLVNLNTGGRKSTFLKMRVSLELGKPEDIPKVETIMPRIIDNFQVYLRELRIEDLKGSAGMYRLREELLARVNAAVAPIEVKDVLFKEMLVQ